VVNITVGRYTPSPDPLPEGVHDVCETWQGWIEPDDRTWIMFVAADGSPTVFLDRDPVTGTVR
jgi:hypothetical protein